MRQLLNLAPMFLLFVSGCGPQIAQVQGKVTFEGKPVTDGIVTFAPKVDDSQFLAGRPASAMLDEKGEFKLTTNRKGDGALVTTHRVTYQPPGPPRDDDPQSEEKYKAFANLRLKAGFEFEVKPGVNTVMLELESVP